MSEFENPPLVSAAPANGQVLKFNSATGYFDPVSAASVGLLTVPQASIVAVNAPAAETATTVTQADAATQTASYVEADVQSIADLANANKAAVNALVTDVAAVITELDALTTKFNTLLTELTSAGIL